MNFILNLLILLPVESTESVDNLQFQIAGENGLDAVIDGRSPAASSPQLETRTYADDLGPAAALVQLARDAGIRVIEREGSGLIRLDSTTLALTDGRTATERMASDGSPIVLFDLALDYAAASRMFVVSTTSVSPSQRPRASPM